MNFLKSLWQEFKSCPIGTIAKWQAARFLWLLMAGASIFLVIVAHSLFQNYVFMKPCEQCVYIRFAFLCMAIGGLIAAINPQNSVLKIIGYIFGFWGIIQGIMYSNKLNLIHHAAHSDDPFGVQGCSAEPSFPLGLPLDVWAPDWFKPTGDCGFDSPIVPDGVELSGLQQFLVDFYADGWYLFPASHSVNMAQACLFAYIVCLILLGAMFLSWVIKMFQSKKA
jgi:disulfide bond formation protein DsbB